MSRSRQLKIGSKPSQSTTIHAKLNATDGHPIEDIESYLSDKDPELFRTTSETTC